MMRKEGISLSPSNIVFARVSDAIRVYLFKIPRVRPAEHVQTMSAERPRLRGADGM